MGHSDIPQLLGLLVVILGAAKLLGALAQRIGQPAVLGELVAGVILGISVLGLVDSTNASLHLLAELGVLILLFEIGLQTDVRKLLRVGGAATAVALVGVALPFALGYGACRFLDQGHLVSVVVGATLSVRLPLACCCGERRRPTRSSNQAVPAYRVVKWSDFSKSRTCFCR